MNALDQGFPGARRHPPGWLARGGQEVKEETVVERIFREVRGFRIYDGPSEIHRWSLAQKIAEHGANQ